MSDNNESGGRIFKATSEIAAVFDAKNLKFNTDCSENDSVVEASFNTEKAGTIRFLFISEDDDNDVAVRVFRVIPSVPEEKREKVIAAINECNDSFRFAKFVLDGDGDINMEYDIATEAGRVGEIALEIAVRFTQIIDDAYPILMKAIWG